MRQRTLLLLMALSLLNGCIRRYEYLPSADSNVRNGIIREEVTIDLHGVRTLIIPEGSVVTRKDGGESSLNVEVIKKLHYLGHPVEKISIETVQRRLLCAMRRKGTRMELCTIGGHTTSAGGLYVNIACVVPSGLVVEYSPSLSNLFRPEELEAEPEWTLVVPNATQRR